MDGMFILRSLQQEYRAIGKKLNVFLYIWSCCQQSIKEGVRVIEEKEEKNTGHFVLISTSGGCEAAVTAGTRCGLNSMEYVDGLIYGRFPSMLKVAV